MQDASRCKTFPFGLRPSSDAHTRQANNSIQIQSGWWESSGDLKAHDTPSVVVGYGRRLTGSAMLHVAHGPPCLQTSASSRRPRSASPPTTKDPPGGASWWFQRMNQHGSARRTPWRHVGSKATRTVPRGGQRSSVRRYLRAPATYASSLKRRGCRRSTALRPTWVRRWHVSSKPTLRLRPTRLWLTYGLLQLWWKKRASVQVRGIYVEPAFA
jgi:hypothetical protein